MSSEIAIRVENLSKCYQIYDRPQDRLKQSILPRLKRLVGQRSRTYFREFWALKDVSFDIGKGETIGIVGRNGSGKSTLLQIICGTLSPTSGTVEINGRVAALLELGAGFNPDFTGRENVYMSAAVLGVAKQEIDRRFEDIAAFADIGGFVEQPVKTYSSGMFARLAFAVAINMDPEILIVDEILAVGDAAFQRKCLQKFYHLRQNGCTILFVSHDQYQVKSICQRALYLEDGRQVMFGAAGRVIDEYMIQMEGKVARTVNVSAAHDPTTKSVAATGGATGSTLPEELQRATHSRQGRDEIFRITSVELQAEDGTPVSEVRCGQSVQLQMRFIATVEDIPPRISFVFNLYRHDGLYICGTTTLMDGYGPHPSGQSGTVTVRFDRLPLLSGRYKWRVAVNDDGGFSVLAEAREACPFLVVDDFKAVGLVTLNRQWRFEIQS